MDVGAFVKDEVSKNFPSPLIGQLFKVFLSFSVSSFYYIISSLQTVAWNGVENKLEADSLLNKEKLEKVGSF